jgi:hypothetical protein
MVPSNSTSSTATLRIPWRRFVTQVFFSVLVVIVSRHLQRWDDSHIRWYMALFGVVLAELAMRVYDRRRARVAILSYCLPLAVCLYETHEATTVIGIQPLRSGAVFSLTQHVAVHFCLAFFAISEIEFYRAYMDVSNLEPGLDTIKYCLLANIKPDHVFPYSRDPYGFGYVSPISPKQPHHAYMKWLGQGLLFQITNALMYVLLKRMVDPGSTKWIEVLGGGGLCERLLHSDRFANFSALSADESGKAG